MHAEANTRSERQVSVVKLIFETVAVTTSKKDKYPTQVCTRLLAFIISLPKRHVPSTSMCNKLVFELNDFSRMGKVDCNPGLTDDGSSKAIPPGHVHGRSEKTSMPGKTQLSLTSTPEWSND